MVELPKYVCAFDSLEPICDQQVERSQFEEVIMRCGNCSVTAALKEGVIVTDRDCDRSAIIK